MCLYFLHRNESSSLYHRGDTLALSAEVDQADVPSASNMGCGGIPRHDQLLRPKATQIQLPEHALPVIITKLANKL